MRGDVALLGVGALLASEMRLFERRIKVLNGVFSGDSQPNTRDDQR